MEIAKLSFVSWRLVVKKKQQKQQQQQQKDMPFTVTCPRGSLKF